MNNKTNSLYQNAYYVNQNIDIAILQYYNTNMKINAETV